MSAVKGSRELVFAKAALKKGLVTQKEAQECLSIARKLAKKKSPLPIETIFVRKGYLRRAEAAALLKRIRPQQKGQPELDLVPESPQAAACTNCKTRDPGEEADCYRCGADRETGGPGPRATVCQACSGVVLRGSAICFHCGATLTKQRRRQRDVGGGSGWDRVILLLTLAGMAYFLIYRNVVKPPPAPVPVAEDPSLADAALDEALGAVKQDPAKALEALRKGLAASEGKERARLQSALAFVASGSEARAAALAALKAKETPSLRRRLAQLAMEAGEHERAVKEIEAIESEARRDDDWRLLARALKAQGKSWTRALNKIKLPLPPEREPLARALWARGQEHLAKGRLEEAATDLERAASLAPRLAGLHATLGTLHLRAQRHQEAVDAFRQAVRLDARPATPYLGMGLALEALGEAPRAKAAYEQFLRLAAEDPAQQERRATVQARLKALAQ